MHRTRRIHVMLSVAAFSLALAGPAWTQGAPAAAATAPASAATAPAPVPGPAAPPGVTGSPAASSGDTADTVRTAVQTWLRGRYKVDEVRRTPVPGIWEVRLGTDLLYVDERGQYAFVEGQLVDMRTNQSLTQARIDQLTAVRWAELPLDIAIKQVNGKGERKVAVFEDPNCVHCRNTRREMNKIDNLTVYTFTLPILAADSERKVRQAWCAPDRVKAWNELLIDGKLPDNPGTCADAPVDKTMALAKKLRVQGTPTIVFPNGKRIPGGVPGPQLQKLVDENGAAKPS